MEKKIFNAPLELKEDGQPGEFKAVFATFNVVDHHKDLTVSTAFVDGQEAIVEPYNHGWTLPAGKGIIRFDDKEAWVEGRFFLDTTVGKDNYETVKGLGGLAEWSYTFEVLDHSACDGSCNSGADRILKKMDVIGFSPVTRGAGINTRTLSIKGDEKPYPNEHACRLRQPDDFQPGSFRRMPRETGGKQYDVIMGRLKGEDTLTEQAYRYSKDIWTAGEARNHCESHGGIEFESAISDSEADSESDDQAKGKQSDIEVKIDIIEMATIVLTQE